MDEALQKAVGQAFNSVEHLDGSAMTREAYAYIKANDFFGLGALSHNPFLREALFQQSVAEKWREKLLKMSAELGLEIDLKFPEVSARSFVDDLISTRDRAVCYSGAARIIYFYVLETGKVPELTEG